MPREGRVRVETGRWLLALWLLTWMPWAWAGASATAPACPGDVLSLAPATGLIGVPEGSLTVDEVMQLPASRFQTVDAGRLLDHGVTDWWLRLKLHNATDHTCRRWLLIGPARLRTVTVFVQRGDGWNIMRSGTSFPWREWALPERQPVFPLTLEPGQTAVVLARVPGSGVMLSFTPELWNPVDYQKVEMRRSLVRGLAYGAIFLLVVVSLILAFVYRRPALCYMALGVGAFVAYVVSQNNYPFIYLWPQSPQWNLWVRYCLSGLYLAGAWAYLSEITRMRRLGRGWARWSRVILVAYLLIAVFGGLLHAPAWISRSMLLLMQASNWLLALVVVVGWRRGLMRSWYPPVLVACLFLRNINWYGHLLGLPIEPQGGNNMFAWPVFGASMFLLGTLVMEVLAGRRRQLRAQAALDRQRATEKQRLERTVALRTDELERALHARSRLLGHISHDLRSPLTGMLDSVRLWRKGDDSRDHARVIERYAQRQMDLIDELLDYTRSELRDLEDNPAPGFLYAFLHDVAEQAELLAARRDNRFEVCLADDLPGRVWADFHLLRRVLFNLLSNAAKFTEHGWIRLSVRAYPASTADRVGLRFVVEDDGPGIAPQERARLMQPYARGERGKGHDGFGLGLAIVGSLLRRMGNKLIIDDSPGGGACFHFLLELETAAEADVEPVVDADEDLDIDGRGRVVLVVDDDRQLRELASDLLDGYGFDAVTAADAVEAAGMVRELDVDVVVTDQYMDGMGGWELLRRIRESRPSLPVVLYSAMPAQRPEDVAATLDFDVTVLKPASGAELVRLVASVAGVPRERVAAVDDRTT